MNSRRDQTHDVLNNNKGYFVMFDMKVDEWVGPVQWSAQMISLTLRPQGRSIEKDKVKDIEVD